MITHSHFTVKNTMFVPSQHEIKALATKENCYNGNCNNNNINSRSVLLNAFSYSVRVADLAKASRIYFSGNCVLAKWSRNSFKRLLAIEASINLYIPSTTIKCKLPLI